MTALSIAQNPEKIDEASRSKHYDLFRNCPLCTLIGAPFSCATYEVARSTVDGSTNIYRDETSNGQIRKR